MLNVPDDVSLLDTMFCRSVCDWLDRPVCDRVHVSVCDRVHVSVTSNRVDFLQVTLDGKMMYLNAVCMGCLEGARVMRCKACKRIWNGSHLILGTMYSYDIFAAMPCCQERLRCNNCGKTMVSVDNPLLFFSEYSRCVACPHCKVLDYHYVKGLNTYSIRENHTF